MMTLDRIRVLDITQYLATLTLPIGRAAADVGIGVPAFSPIGYARVHRGRTGHG